MSESTHNTTVPQEQPQQNATCTTKNITDLRADLANQIIRAQTDQSLAVREAFVSSVLSSFSNPQHPVIAELVHHTLQFANAAPARKIKCINCPLVRQHASVTLNREGRRLVRRLTQFPGSITVISHALNEQRKIALRAATNAWRQEGPNVIICSPCRRPPKELEGKTEPQSMTTCKRRHYFMQPSFATFLGPEAEQFVRALGGRITFSFDTFPIDRSRVLILDRADRLSLEELSKVVQNVQTNGGKLVLLTPLIGDLPSARSTLTASLLADLSGRMPTHMRLPRRERPKNRRRPQESKSTRNNYLQKGTTP